MQEDKRDGKVENQAQGATQGQAAGPAQEVKPSPDGTGGGTAPIKKDQKAATVKKEEPTNCAGCNKSIKKIRHYYRNGKYFCTKRCWKTTLKKEEPKEEPKSAESK